MNLEDLQLIERHLNLVLPDVYRQTLLVGVTINGADPEPYFVQDAKELLLSNLELRMRPAPNAFAGAPWPAEYFCIGNDGCGNEYAIDVRDPACQVRLCDHDLGAFDPRGDDLPGYLRSLKDLFDWRDTTIDVYEDAADVGVDSAPSRYYAVVTRANERRESVLNPITLDEWKTVVAADPDLQLREYEIRRNPFSAEEIRISRPGLAVMNGLGAMEKFEFFYGRITVCCPSVIALEKLAQFALALNAKLITD